jgi:hypothetical protein
MRVSVRIRNETQPKAAAQYPHIIEVWDQHNLKPTTFKLNDYEDWNKLGKHIKSVVQSYMLPPP